MNFRLPHIANTLLFRVAATVVLLVGVALGGYYIWIESTVFNPFPDDQSETWYSDLAEAELDSLAAEAANLQGDRGALNRRLVSYGAGIREYGAEVIIFDAAGRHLASSAPDSLAEAVPLVSTELLLDMSDGEWDYSSYPDATDIDAFENRIFEVDRISADDGESVAAFLVANFRPVTVVSDDLNADSRLIDAQSRIFKILTILLIVSSVTALLIMFWTERRVRRLAAGVEVFATGDLSHRLTTRSTDAIGSLGNSFNQMATRLEAMVEKLTQKEQFQRQLVANISHDLRTPMASMRGYVETLLLDEGQLDAAEKERCLKIINGNLEHLDRLVDHTLVLSRFDSGQASFQIEDFSILELCDSVLTRFEGIAAEHGVELDLQTDGDVGLVRADPLQIAQVLQNLLENGIKFNRPQGSVTLHLTRQADRIAIAVRDTGRGIPAEDLAQIFDRFYTGDEGRTRLISAPEAAEIGAHLGQSTGLGLAIAAKIVAGHNSILRAESHFGKGSEFSFQLSCASDSEPADQGLSGAD